MRSEFTNILKNNAVLGIFILCFQCKAVLHKVILNDCIITENETLITLQSVSHFVILSTSNIQ
jgi:hypothetical protein